MRFFNTAGPCEPSRHYMLPTTVRLPDVHRLIADKHFFVLHAPRQTGKTTCLRQLAKELTEAGQYTALYFSCEAGEAFRENADAVELIVIDSLRLSASLDLPKVLQPPPTPPASPGARLRTLLAEWAHRSPRPLVLFFDEIDALQGDSLRSVLRQLRAGFPDRPTGFPGSVVLCGLRDVRDYKDASGGNSGRLGTSSPFNIKVESLTLSNFTREEVATLYQQHRDQTGQPFEDGVYDRAYDLTGGQPWLVNALARELTHKLNIPPEQPITLAHLDRAKENLILARQTHLDSLVARLLEPRVRRIIAPLMMGSFPMGLTYDDDASYVRDLGLITRDRPIRIANPIYREVIVRVLNGAAQDCIVTDPRSFVRPDGSLNLRQILNEFADFWREHGEILGDGMPYHEVAPQLVFMAYLQRVVNGGGYIDREFGVGRGRIDLLMRWPYRDASGDNVMQREAFELKVRTDKTGDPLAKGLKQLDGYLDRLGLNTGVLVIFDRREGIASFEERTVFESARSPAGREVLVLRA